MYKKLLLTLVTIILFAFLARSSFAATSVRLEQPKSPTNQNSFNLVFVALDTEDNPVTVTCWKQGPSDAGLVQFGSSIVLSNGGNSDNCPVDSSIITTAGTYTFQVQANGTPSNTVAVAFDSTTPGDPTGYHKSQNGSCEYDISFTTANDGGQTVKVELYRSDSTNFSVDDTSRVDSQNIGSNTNGSFANNVPDCNKQWYYAIRAISSDGNASNPVGDSQTTTNTVIVNPTTTTQQGGAIALANNGNNQVTQPTGEQGGKTATTPAPTGEGQKNVLGTQTKATPTPANNSVFATVLMHKATWAGIIAAILILLGVGYYFFMRPRTRNR